MRCAWRGPAAHWPPDTRATSSCRAKCFLPACRRNITRCLACRVKHTTSRGQYVVLELRSHLSMTPMSKRMQGLFILLSGTIWAAMPAFGQAGRAELFGAIQDPAGLPVPKAKVEAEDQATMVRYSAVSDERGEYRVMGLPAGQYVLTVHQPGFRTYRQSGIALRLADGTALDVKLEVGQPSQSVEVIAAAPLLQTASGEVSLNVEEKKITTLPLDGRNVIPLVTLSPGVALPNGQLLPRINGSRPRTNEYIYDGISVLQPEPGQVVFYPIIDGMAEFKLNVNAYSPEYGRSNGGTIMVIGKSGSNEFHGSVFEFFRNEALNARNLFAQPGPKPEFRRNQYGLTLGGPVQANKTFFFVDWQGSRLRTGTTRFSTVPTPAQRQGIFFAAVFDPATSPRQPFANNTIPVSRFDSLGLQVLQHYPVPNLPGAANNFVLTATEPDNQDQFDTRLDHYFGEKHRVFGRYTYFRDDDTPVTPLPDGSGSLTSGVIGHAITRGDALAGDYNWTPSPTLLNQLRVGYSRRGLDQTSLQNGGIAVPDYRQTHLALCCQSSTSVVFSRSAPPPPRIRTSPLRSPNSWIRFPWFDAGTPSGSASTSGARRSMCSTRPIPQARSRSTPPGPTVLRRPAETRLRRCCWDK